MKYRSNIEISQAVHKKVSNIIHRVLPVFKKGHEFNFDLAFNQFNTEPNYSNKSLAFNMKDTNKIFDALNKEFKVSLSSVDSNSIALVNMFSLISMVEEASPKLIKAREKIVKKAIKNSPAESNAVKTKPPARPKKPRKIKGLKPTKLTVGVDPRVN